MNQPPDHHKEPKIDDFFGEIIVGSAFSNDLAVSGSAPESSVSAVSGVEIDLLFSEANALHRQGWLEEAEVGYRKVIAHNPNHHKALHFLGVIALAQKKYSEAIALIEQSLQINGATAVYFNNYGVVLRELKRFEDAEAAFLRAIAVKPNYPDALSNLGMIGIQLNRPLKKTEQYLLDALKLQPNHRDALGHIVGLYAQQKRFPEAARFLEQIIKVEPNNPGHRHQLGCFYGECGEIVKAKEQFQLAASLPNTPAVWKWKHLWFSPAFFNNETEIDEYWSRLNADLDEALAERPLYNWRQLAHDGFTHSFHLPHHDRSCREVLEKFARLFTPSFPPNIPKHRPGEKIRVGFLVSPGHEGGFLRLSSGIIENLDPERFEPVLIYNETTSKRFENRFKRPELVHVPYSWNFEQAVTTIKNAKCDLIYYWKVGADHWSFFLPMCRLAPIQCTSWSTHGTSGLDLIDYYVSWDKAEIPVAQNHYTEKLFLLKTTPLYEPKLADTPAPATREELKLPTEGAIYFCPHRPSKYHPKFDDYLRGILKADPTGHVVLLVGKTRFVSDRVIERIRKNVGEECFKRMIFVPQLSVKDYYRFLSVSTVILNSPIYSGEITAIDGFLYGIPCVAYTGELLIQRYSTAFYEAFGIDGPAVTSKEDYIAQAVKLGTDHEYRDEISRKIVGNHDGFFENMNTVREWERFIETAVHDSQDGRKTNSLTSSSPVRLNNMEVNVAYGCNMKCNFCSHFSHLMSGLEKFGELKEWYRTWHKKISPNTIRVIGGEPLLHPELVPILKETKERWPDSRIDLVTNGLLLSRHTEVLEALREIDGYVYISRHFLDPEYLSQFEPALEILKASGVGFTMYTSELKWRKYYREDATGRPAPYCSRPDLAWRNCQTKNFCPTLLYNKLYKCQHLAHAIYGLANGILSKAWDAAATYRPLEPSSTQEEIWHHLNSEAVPECAICPEKYEFVDLESK